MIFFVCAKKKRVVKGVEFYPPLGDLGSRGPKNRGVLGYGGATYKIGQSSKVTVEGEL